MSFLETLVSDIGSAISDPGRLLTDALDSVLPNQLKSVADLAGGVVDLVVGQKPQAIALFKDGIKDLPQLTSAAPAGASAGTRVAAVTAEPSPPAGSAGSSTPNDVASLLALPDGQLMQAVASGAVPADVASDPSAMLQIQARVNEIAQMNQLVTSMLSTTHQMQMSIAQNIRA
jgi:hypothetical protein